jgi:quercetin dioxygenase-like cupin family protein
MSFVASEGASEKGLSGWSEADCKRVPEQTAHAYCQGSAEFLSCTAASDLTGNTDKAEPFTPILQEVTMADTTVKKVSSAHSPTGDDGEVYLASGKRVSMRLWRDEEPTQSKPARKHDYEVVGYVISGRAELVIEGQTVRLEPGDSWVVPAGSEHTYRILETFTAVEATAPPYQVHGRE